MVYSARRSARRYMPFTYKTMIPYLLLVLLTDAVIGSISYSMLTDSRTEMAETSIRTSMKQASANIRYKMDEIQRMSDTLFGSVPFQRALQEDGDPLDVYLTMTDEIIPALKAPLQLFGNDIRLMLYTPNPDLNAVSGDNLELPIKNSDYYILPLAGIEDADWFDELENEDRDNGWLQIDTDRKLGNISHFRRLVSYSDYKTGIGYIRITASLEDLFGGLEAFPIAEGFTVSMLDSSAGQTLFRKGPQQEPEEGSGSVSYLTLSERIPGTDLLIETKVPRRYLTRDAGRLQQAIVLVCALSFAVMACIGFLVARLSGRKISRILSTVRSFQKGRLEKRLHFSGSDEFVQIADAFNAMAASIDELLRSVYRQGVQTKQAELEALQAQINPHFLYNTLSTISSLANLGEIGKVTEMVHGLSRFYRLTLNRGSVQITVERELEQIEAYLDIQRVKYAEAFRVHFDIEPGIEQATIIKLVLQPFVENIFKHAWFGERISILITGRREDDLIVLQVIDDGIGMKPGTLRELTEPREASGDEDGHGSSGGYGVKNVDERIKLKYGQPYGVVIGSVYGGGTTVRLTFPADLPEPGAAEKDPRGENERGSS
ncbi:sensor histidine kinase [Saccharibacillus sp. CPCC 101409]|uniref:sensor histidine kinase n=1 Tax=Saccharibacillus sp. CPCC 101409 TaxID=3058041 RepID=UPI002671E7CC|nr:sensor histidine kinase [Saccharibacillus sp. CPCC 101409]MDO3409288.1 sensor histidine kinase [Saccharibacillus sp. CPCC 101409]